jgi:hypothetical protein
LKRALKVGSLTRLVRGDHVGETADGETVIRGSSAPDGDFDLGKPKPVGHVASSSESACGAIIGVVEAQVVDDVESHPWDETVLPVDVCLVLSGLVDQHVLDRLKVLLCGDRC